MKEANLKHLLSCTGHFLYTEILHRGGRVIELKNVDLRVMCFGSKLAPVT